MDITDEVLALIGQQENTKLEYKAVLPPSRILGQILASFANAEGGYLILGVVENPTGVIVNGLSSDFNANSITHKAIDLLIPKPVIHYQYIVKGDKSIYAIKIEKSPVSVEIEGQVYIREGARTVLKNPVEQIFKNLSYGRLKILSKDLENFKTTATDSQTKFLDHYLSILNIADDSKNLLYPNSPTTAPTTKEGKALMRMLFSSCADSFEIYLSDLLYEIYLVNPSTLKSNQTVTIKEVLDCNDMQEFVIYWSNKRLSKLQRGSVKGFISDNNQLNDLKVLDTSQQDIIDKTLQIRHLYSHRNGVVDEKFLQFFPGQFTLNSEHVMSVEQVLNHLKYFADTVNRIDAAAILKYQLVTLS